MNSQRPKRKKVDSDLTKWIHNLRYSNILEILNSLTREHKIRSIHERTSPSSISYMLSRNCRSQTDKSRSDTNTLNRLVNLTSRSTLMVCLVNGSKVETNSVMIATIVHDIYNYMSSGAYEPPEGRKERLTAWNGI